MNDRMSVDEYRRSQGLAPRGQPLEIFDARGAVNRTQGLVLVPVPAKRHHELGRRPSTEMNKTEARYEREVLAPAKAAGEVVWYGFNSVKFRIAEKRCWLTIDFFVLFADGHLEAVDVKGAVAITEEDAKVKMKVAASLYPFPFKFAFPRPRKLGGGWLIQEV